MGTYRSPLDANKLCLCSIFVVVIIIYRNIIPSGVARDDVLIAPLEYEYERKERKPRQYCRGLGVSPQTLQNQPFRSILSQIFILFRGGCARVCVSKLLGLFHSASSTVPIAHEFSYTLSTFVSSSPAFALIIGDLYVFSFFFFFFLL